MCFLNKIKYSHKMSYIKLNRKNGKAWSMSVCGEVEDKFQKQKQISNEVCKQKWLW